MIDIVLANEGLTLFSKRTRPTAPIAAHPKQTKPAQKGFSISEYRIQPLKPSQNYLINRGITPQTLTSPLFAGAIMEGNKADNHINNIIYPFKCHPAHTTEQMVTLMQQFNKKLEIDDKLTDKFFAKGEGKNKSLWFSNLLPSIRFIYIFENPLDAFSHFQLRNPENALYCATGGNPAKQQIALIIDLCAELKASPVLCFDRDLAGCRFDTLFLASVEPDKISITTSSEFSYNVQVSNISSNLAKCFFTA